MDNREMEIRACRAEVETLTQRVNALRLRLDALEGAQREVRPKPQPVPVPAPVRAQPPKQEEAPKQYQNLESAVGRNLFAVLASVLVLLGVGVFISTIYEQIPEIIKIIAIYIFGLVVLGVGLVLYRKNDNRFWLGVASCGLAELLVSIITSHSYFHVLSLTGTFLLVLVWIIGSFLLTKYHPTVFKTIGFIGFLISMILGLDLLEGGSPGIYLTLLGAYAVLSVFFMVTNGSFVKMNTAMAFGSALGLLLFYDLNAVLPENTDWLSGIIALSILGVFHVVYVWKAKLHRDAYAAYSVVTVGVAALFLAVYKPEVVIPAAGVLVFLLWVIQSEMKINRTARSFYTALAGLYLAFLGYFVVFHDRPEMWWFPVFTAGAYGLYWYTRRRDIAWLGLLCFVVFYTRGITQDWIYYGAFAVAAGMFYLCGSKWLRRDDALQMAWYVVLFVIAHTLQSLIRQPFLTDHDNFRSIYQISDGIFYTILAVVNTWYLHHCMADPEKLLNITPRSLVVMVLQCYVFVQCMMAVDSGIWYVTLMGILGSMLVLSYSLWYSFKTKGRSRNLMVWQFIKFTLYCWVILAMLDSPSILMHISLLLVAILAVALGFKLGHKAVRVYGLVLSLVDVVSLVLFNIDFGNSLQLAGGIVLCGVLCFVISFIYSRLSKVF